nr:hypothetical protein Iba_chr05bCG4520 [Ipomoea batatas]GMC97509.1 hypothetical protein Iba_chr05dCG7690 [Ipomoea batatas]
MSPQNQKVFPMVFLLLISAYFATTHARNPVVVGMEYENMLPKHVPVSPYGPSCRSSPGTPPSCFHRRAAPPPPLTTSPAASPEIEDLGFP